MTVLTVTVGGVTVVGGGWVATVEMGVGGGWGDGGGGSGVLVLAVVGGDPRRINSF